MNEDELDRDVACEAERVRQIVKQMLDDGCEPALLVFLRADGTTRLWHREGLDVDGFIAFLAATETAPSARLA